MLAPSLRHATRTVAIAGCALALSLPAAIAQVPIETSEGTPPTDTPGTTPPSGQRFSCQTQGGQPVVMYQPKSQPGQYFPWAQPSTMGGGWSSDRRCLEIARRLESYRPDGLIELQTGTKNGYNILCATTEKNPACRIVLTVPVGADPIQTRDRVFGNLTIADSGQQTTAVNTYASRRRSAVRIPGTLPDPLSELLGSLPIGDRGTLDPAPASAGSRGLYLKPFLDPADGGTGAAWADGGTAGGRRLRPENFR